MIGIDTNVLLRLVLDDDPAQNGRIDALFAEHASLPGSVLLSDVVLAEAVWTLQSAYAQPKSALLTALGGLLGQPAFAFENRAVVERALADFRVSSAGFADCLIAARHAALGCEFTATFDRRMSGLKGVKRL